MRSAAALLLAGCLFPPHDYAGLDCSADHPCPPGYDCIGGVCGGNLGGGSGGGSGGSGGSGEQNLLPNGDFESSSPGAEVTQWYATSTPQTGFVAQTARVRNGTQAMRVFTAQVGGTLGIGVRRELVPAMAATKYCVEAWVDFGNQPGPIRITTRRYADAGSDWDDDQMVNVNRTSGWQRLSSTVTTAPPWERNVNFRLSGDAFDGGEFFVDDARIWKPANGTCP